MQRFWQTFIENIVLLMLLLPLLGAALVLTSAWMGTEAVRRTALTNVLLSLALAVLMVAHYDPPQATDADTPQLVQMQSHFTGTGSPEAGQYERAGGVGLRVGVDGLSLWFVALTALLMVPVVVLAARSDETHPAALYVGLLLFQSATVGLFAALDVVLFLLCLLVSPPVMFLLIGRWGGPKRRPAATKFFLWNLAGSLLVALGLIALVVAWGWMHRLAFPAQSPALTFSIPMLIQGIPALAKGAAGQYWTQAAPWMFLLLTTGFVLRMPVVPFHTWLADAQTEAAPAVGLLLTAVGLKVGCYGLLRFVLPLFPPLIATTSESLLPLVMAGVVYAGLLALVQEDLGRRIAAATIAQMGLCVAGVLALHPIGAAGSVLLAMHHGLAAGGLLFLAARFAPVGRIANLPAPVGRISNPSASGSDGLEIRPTEEAHPAARPRLRLCLLLFVLAMIGVPGLGGFTGEWLALLGVYSGPAAGTNPAAAFWGLVGSLLLVAAFLPLVRSLVVEARPPPCPAARPGSADDLSPGELATLAPLLAVIVWIGLAPQFFVSRIEPTVTRSAGLLPDPRPSASSAVIQDRHRRSISCPP